MLLSSTKKVSRSTMMLCKPIGTPLALKHENYIRPTAPGEEQPLSTTTRRWRSPPKSPFASSRGTFNNHDDVPLVLLSREALRVTPLIGTFRGYTKSHHSVLTGITQYVTMKGYYQPFILGEAGDKNSKNSKRVSSPVPPKPRRGNNSNNHAYLPYGRYLSPESPFVSLDLN